MWTPPQWRPGFVLVFLATAGVCGALTFAHARASAWGLGVSTGVIVGIYLAMAWTVRRQVWPLSAALATTSLPLIVMLWLLRPTALMWAPVSAAAVIGAWLASYGAVGRSANREIVRQLEPLGGEGVAGHALIVHHPGRGGFQTALQRAFADGLKAQGWQVDLATAGPLAPRDLVGVDLLVLGAPVYNFRPARPLLRYLDRLGRLPAPPMVLILSGGGMTDVAMRELKTRAAKAGGRILAAYELWTQRPNSERYDLDDALTIVRRAGAELIVPHAGRAA